MPEARPPRDLVPAYSAVNSGSAAASRSKVSVVSQPAAWLAMPRRQSAYPTRLVRKRRSAIATSGAAAALGLLAFKARPACTPAIANRGVKLVVGDPPLRLGQDTLEIVERQVLGHEPHPAIGFDREADAIAGLELELLADRLGDGRLAFAGQVELSMSLPFLARLTFSILPYPGRVVGHARLSGAGAAAVRSATPRAVAAEIRANAIGFCDLCAETAGICGSAAGETACVRT